MIKPGSKKRRMTRTKTHEAAGEDGDESVNDGSVSDEEHPARAPSHTSTSHKLVSHTKVSLYKLAIQYEYLITTWMLNTGGGKVKTTNP